MRPGQLDRRVALQRRTGVPDGGGGTTYTWAAIASVWAHVVAKSGREMLSEGRMAAEGVYVFTIRHRDGLVETDRIVWEGENYNIRNIMRTGGRPLYLQIEAERGVGQ